MRRAISILLLMLLPMQWSWAVAAAYCKHSGEHEAVVGQAHFGHHEHSLAPKPAVPKASDLGVTGISVIDAGVLVDVDSDQASDAECGICHLSAIQAAVSVVDDSVAVLGNELLADYQANWSSSPSGTFFRPPLTARP